jgi:hypothetical protein
LFFKKSSEFRWFFYLTNNKTYDIIYIKEIDLCLLFLKD